MRSSFLTVALITILCGCAPLDKSRDKRDNSDRFLDRSSPRSTSNPSTRPFWNDFNETGRSKDRPKDSDSVLAGRIVDPLDPDRDYSRAQIVIKPSDGSSKDEEFIETDSNGSFRITGLNPKKSYWLDVVFIRDGKTYGGSVTTRPPSTNVVINISEDQVSSVTPRPRPGLGESGPFAAPKHSADPPKSPPSTEKGFEPGTSPPKRDDLPSLPPPPPANKPTQPDSFIPRPQNVASENYAFIPPVASIPNPDQPSRPAPTAVGSDLDTTKHSKTGPVAPTLGTTPGTKVPNFSLLNLYGDDWNYHQASGQLILLHFWSTTCAPCAKAFPKVNRLAKDYGGEYLEVVGIACEPADSWKDRVKKVESVWKNKGAVFQTYLEADGRVGGVQRMFNVNTIPRLVLLDRKGNTLWEGGASDRELADLERTINDALKRR